MLIRVKQKVGDLGWKVDGILVRHNYNSGAFEADDETAKRLIAKGYVEAVENETATVQTAPVAVNVEETEDKKDLSEMTLKELREVATERGIKPGRLSKADLLSLLMEETEEAKVNVNPTDTVV